MSKITCPHCNKLYASKNSLGNHIRNYHNTENTLKLHTNKKFKKNKSIKKGAENGECIINVSSMYHGFKKKNIENVKPLFKCKYCDNEYSTSQNRSRHYRTCEKKKESLRGKDLEEHFNRIIYDMTKQLEEQKKEIRKLKRQRTNNVRNTTNNNTNNTNSHNINNINNGTVNNIKNEIKIIAFGNENLPNVLSNAKQLDIINRGNDSLTYLIKHIHFNPEYPEFQNVRITNLRSNVGEVYDNKYNKFIKKPKNEILEDVKTERMLDIENFVEYNGDDMEEGKRNGINKFIDRMYEDNKYNKKQNEPIACILYNGLKNTIEASELKKLLENENIQVVNM